MPLHVASGTTHYRRVMFFIDGGYLRAQLKRRTKKEDFKIDELINIVLGQFMVHPILGELIRTYYYDAIYDKPDERYEARKAYFDKLNEKDFVEVKLGEIVSSPKGDRQKGVDVLIAIDMLTKAYENHYDIAILLSGDRDLRNLVKAVKDQAGKRVYGVFFENHCPPELRREFDKYLEIKESQNYRFWMFDQS